MHSAAAGEKNSKITTANRAIAGHCDIVVCTTGGQHLMDHDVVKAVPGVYHVRTKMEPMLLGFACHHVLREGLGKYDYYAYMEDDLGLADPLALVKLKWFTDTFGDDVLLQPNRFESCPGTPVDKIYIDGPVRSDFTAKWQDVNDRRELRAEVMGKEFVFHRSPNPHSGCFFLNARQMEHWASQPYFLDGDTSFAGPLESAATLGVMKTFRIYKPSPQNAGFFEIRHLGRRYLGKSLVL